LALIGEPGSGLLWLCRLLLLPNRDAQNEIPLIPRLCESR
jgi:hypothetical protein